MAKKWKVGAIYELVDEVGFLSNVSINDKIMPYISDKFKVLELDEWGDVVSVENIDLNIISKWSDWVTLVTGERKFFKRVKNN